MTPEHTDMTGAARLREALEQVGEALSMLSCPAYDGEGKCQSGCYQEPACITDQPHGGWLAMATAGLDSAFEALAAVPEAPEPVYEWRAVHGAWKSVPMATRESIGSRFGTECHIERRTAPGPWERVEEGTER